MSKSATQPTEIKGGIIIQGSLLWEDENTCLTGDKTKEQEEKDKGKDRREWRENQLNIKDSFQIPFPVRYGRCSSSRRSTYTMVMSKDYLAIDKIGQAIVTPFNRTFQSNNLEEVTNEIKEITKVEGISSQKTSFAKEFSAIAIWINPNSNFKTHLRIYWSNLIKSFGYENKFSYDWSDGTLITDKYTMDFDVDVKNLDFLLLTYMMPSHKINYKRSYPTPKEIAEEIKRTGYSTYFCKNRVSGIITSDDDEIFKHIK